MLRYGTSELEHAVHTLYAANNNGECEACENEIEIYSCPLHGKTEHAYGMLLNEIGYDNLGCDLAEVVTAMQCLQRQLEDIANSIAKLPRRESK